MNNVTPNADSWELADEVKHDFEEAGYTSADYPLNERIAVALTVYANKKIAELEPAAGDAGAAEELARKFWELAQELLGTRPDISHNAVIESMAIDIAAALSAARGNRKALEDELKKWHEIGRRAKRNLDAPFTAENPVQILIDAAALAVLEVKV